MHCLVCLPPPPTQSPRGEHRTRDRGSSRGLGAATTGLAAAAAAGAAGAAGSHVRRSALLPPKLALDRAVCRTAPPVCRPALGAAAATAAAASASRASQSVAVAPCNVAGHVAVSGWIRHHGSITRKVVTVSHPIDSGVVECGVVELKCFALRGQRSEAACVNEVIGGLGQRW